MSITGDAATTRGTTIEGSVGGPLGCIEVGVGVAENGIVNNVRNDGVLDRRQSMRSLSTAYQAANGSSNVIIGNGQINLPTGGYVQIDGENSAADNLDLLEQGEDGQIVVLTCADPGKRAITVSHGQTSLGDFKRIFNRSGADLTLSNIFGVQYQYRAAIAAWIEI